MSKRFSGLKSFGSKAVSVIASGALALSLTPAIALANTADLQAQSVDLSTQHYEYSNKSGLAIGNQNGDYPAGQWVQTAAQAKAGTYIYKGYAHGDNAHYGTYSLYTELTVKNKVLTGINLRSGVDTFFGKWGMYSPHSDGWVVDGWLPDGVNLKVDRTTDAAGNPVLTPVLSGADAYGSSVSGVYLESTDGVNLSKAYTQTTTTTNRRTGEKTTSTAETDKFAVDSADNAADYGGWADGKLTIRSKLGDGKANPTNLVNIVYKIGEYAPFSTYIMVDDTDADADKYLDSIVATDYSGAAKVDGMGNTNRDRWTKTMLTETAQRWLIPWISGETEELDTISGATKTSEPFDEALNEAAIAGYFTSVADDLKLTIDEGDNVEDTQTFGRSDYTDQTTVSINEAGQYVLDADFFSSEAEGTHGVVPNSIEVYAIDENGPAVTQNLQRATPGYTAESSTTSVSTAYDGDDFSWNPDTGELVVKDPAVTHVRMVYTLGHADSRHAYSLADMVQVGEVESTISAMNASDAKSVAAARLAYDALSSDVRGFVTNYSTLAKAESAAAQPAKQTISGKKSASKTLTVGKGAKKLAKKTKALTLTNKGKTATTYAVKTWTTKAAKKYFTVAKKTGVITAAKGTPKGTYKFTVTATAKKTAAYAKATKDVAVTVKVK